MKQDFLYPLAENEQQINNYGMISESSDLILRQNEMSSLKKGDMVRWNSSFGETHGKITHIHTKDFTFMNRQRRASEDEPQYEVMSEKSGKSAVHKASALKKM